MVRVRIGEEFCAPEFVQMALRTRLVRTQIEKPLRTTSGVKNINSTEISRLVFPLMSLSEQLRIVTKVDELMALCDTLKTHLNTAQTTQLQLADAMAEQAIA